MYYFTNNYRQPAYIQRCEVVDPAQKNERLAMNKLSYLHLLKRIPTESGSGRLTDSKCEKVFDMDGVG